MIKPDGLAKEDLSTKSIISFSMGGPCLSLAFLLTWVTPLKYALWNGDRNISGQLKALDQFMLVHAMLCPGLHGALGPAAVVYSGLI